MPKYNLSSLTEFNKGLVYGFEPEGSPKGLAGSGLLEDYLYHVTGQHRDVLQAYLFAQEVVLPELKKGVDKLTPEKLLHWIKQIHQRIAHTLLLPFDVQSGEYYQSAVLRWEPGYLIIGNIALFLSRRYPGNGVEAFAEACSKELEVNKNELTAFVKLLLEKFANDTSIQLTREQKMDLQNEDQRLVKGLAMIMKMTTVYHSDYFNNDEKEIIKRIVTVCLPPEQVPAAMENYAADFVKEIQSVDANALDSIANFIAERFFELTEIHPFPNGNGRTATCLMNILLRAYNQPSILLRYPNERHNPNSSYTRAFDAIAESRDLFKAHIKQRILDESKTPYSNEKLQKTIELRVSMALICKRIETKHPSSDINAIFKKADDSIPLVIYMVDDEEHKMQLALQSLIASLGTVEKQLDVKKASSKETVIEKLIGISGEKAWKAYKNGSLYLLENTSISHISTIAEKLKATEAMKVTITRRMDTQIPVLKIEQVNALRLSNYSIPEVQEVHSAPASSPATLGL